LKKTVLQLLSRHYQPPAVYANHPLLDRQGSLNNILGDRMHLVFSLKLI